MLQNMLTVGTQVLILFLLILLGYIAGKPGYLRLRPLPECPISFCILFRRV